MGLSDAKITKALKIGKVTAQTLRRNTQPPSPRLRELRALEREALDVEKRLKKLRWRVNEYIEFFDQSRTPRSAQLLADAAEALLGSPRVRRKKWSRI